MRANRVARRNAGVKTEMMRLMVDDGGHDPAFLQECGNNCHGFVPSSLGEHSLSDLQSCGLADVDWYCPLHRHSSQSVQRRVCVNYNIDRVRGSERSKLLRAQHCGRT